MADPIEQIKQAIIGLDKSERRIANQLLIYLMKKVDTKITNLFDKKRSELSEFDWERFMLFDPMETNPRRLLIFTNSSNIDEMLKYIEDRFEEEKMLAKKFPDLHQREALWVKEARIVKQFIIDNRSEYEKIPPRKEE